MIKKKKPNLCNPFYVHQRDTVFNLAKYVCGHCLHNNQHLTTPKSFFLSLDAHQLMSFSSSLSFFLFFCQLFFIATAGKMFSGSNLTILPVRILLEECY